MNVPSGLSLPPGPGGASSSTPPTAKRDGRSQPLLRFDKVTKTFPGVVANRDVSLEIGAGEIVSLLGENGAGKTTLMNILYGLYQADEGVLYLRGERFSPKGPRDAIAAGVGMVHQHFMLIPTLTVVENVVVGLRERGWSPRLTLQQSAERLRALSREFGLEIRPDERVSSLSVGEQQRVEIVKALFRGADVLILDEPTAVLSAAESAELFNVLRRFAAKGGAVIFISHKLDEVLEVSDRIVVLRHGAVVGHADPTTADRRELVGLMVGKDVDLDVPKAAAAPGPAVLDLEGVTAMDERGTVRLHDVSVAVRSGEIVAIAGVEGNGQRELAGAITGMLDHDEGRIQLHGTDVTRLSVADRWERGLRYVPEDRHGTGLVLDFDVGENAVLRQFTRPPFSRRGRLRRRAIARFGRQLVRDHDVRVASPGMAVRNLSGGNQQKIILGRETHGDLSCLVAAQATRGLDVMTARAVLRRIVELRDSGAAVLYLSSDLDEILAIGDRIAVLYGGRLIGPFDRADVDRELLGHLLVRGAADLAPRAGGRQ
jgi:ABC-type uncharacterized transport system ATPase subunit